jgi:hypothetical protein
MHTSRLALFAAPTVLLFTACETTAPRPMARLSLSAGISASAVHAAPSGPAMDVIVSGSGGSVKITSAQIMLSDLRLKGAACAGTEGDEHSADSVEAHDSAEAADSGEAADTTHEGPDTNAVNGDNNDEHDCAPLDVGPVTVNLPLDGTTKVVLDGLVPAGSYTGLRAKFESVNVVGVFTDSGGTDHPFTFTSNTEAELEMDFAAPVTVGSGTNNLTINVDVSTWFKTASGAVLDPTNPANQEAIERTIRASLRTFEDDNHDGTDDQAGH